MARKEDDPMETGTRLAEIGFVLSGDYNPRDWVRFVQSCLWPPWVRSAKTGPHRYRPRNGFVFSNANARHGDHGRQHQHGPPPPPKPFLSAPGVIEKLHLLLNWNNRMKNCYIDAFSGLAGDMLAAALADAGADRDTITRALESFAIGASIQWDRVQRRGISALKFRVGVTEPPKHRHLSGILKMIHAADLPESVKAKSERVFRVLGEAESAIHGVDIEKVHFHEVGAVDSICDIVGICLAFDLLAIECIHCSPINVGSGTVKTEHGILPVPAPATAKLLAGKPIYSRGPAVELTTPTGAAVVAALATDFGVMPPMRIKSIGYGAGDHDFTEHANVVRVMVGKTSGAVEATTVSVIEANIDDASPQ